MTITIPRLPASAVRWRGVVVINATAAACALTVGLHWHSAQGVEIVDDLDRVAPSFRFTQARIAGLTYRPMRRPTRGTTDEDWSLLAVVNRTAEDARRDPSVRNLHRLGIAYVLAANPESAAESLQKAITSQTAIENVSDAIHKSTDGRLLTDLAGAYLTCAEFNDRPLLLPAAVEAAERAWQLSRSEATAWNRALLSEKIGARNEAIHAWNDYLRIDGLSPWSQEARTHIGNLSNATAAESWTAKRARFIAALREMATAEARQIAGSFPAQVEEYASDELLYAWGGDTASESAFTTLCAISDALHERGRGATAAECRLILSSNDATLQTLRDAHALYGSARAAYTIGKIGDAARDLARARELFENANAPFRFMAAVYEASCRFLLRDFAGVHEIASRNLVRLSGRNDFDALVGQLEWLDGMSMLAIGNMPAARSAYERASDAFERCGDRDGEAALQSLRAELFSYVGDDAAAWEHRHRSLDLVAEGVSRRRIHPILNEAAEACVRDGNFLAARLLHDELAIDAREHRDSSYLCDALLGRGTAELAAGLKTEAAGDIREAWQVLSSLSDSGLRARTEANLSLLEAEALLDTDPRSSLRLAGEARQSFQAAGERFRYCDASLVHARAARNLRMFDEAECDLYDAIPEITDQEALAGALTDRLRFAATRSAVGTELVRLLVRRVATTEALVAHERLCATAITTAYFPSRPFRSDPVRALQERLPASTAVIVYAVDETVTYAWLLTRNAIVFASATVSRAALDQNVAAFDRAVGDGTSDDRANAFLYGALLRPFDRHLPGIRRLFFVPDGSLHGLAFAALHGDSRFLPERFEVGTVPNLAILIASSERSAKLAARSLTAVVAIEDVHNLRNARAEAAEISRWYGRGRLLRNQPVERFIAEIRSTDVIHIVGHADTGSDAPFSSGFTGVIAVRSADILGGPPLREPLVVLAGCGTRVSSVYGHEGPAAIADAFLAKGASAVLATMWNVEDASARDVSVRFHHRFKACRDPMRALRDTQLQMIHDHRSPAAWAGFQLSGGAV